MNIQHRRERYFEEDYVWVMDSECCCKCGALLDEGEIDICWFCVQYAGQDEEQDYYDGWGSDWDVPIEETGKP